MDIYKVPDIIFIKDDTYDKDILSYLYGEE